MLSAEDFKLTSIDVLQEEIKTSYKKPKYYFLYFISITLLIISFWPKLINQWYYKVILILLGIMTMMLIQLLEYKFIEKNKHQ